MSRDGILIRCRSLRKTYGSTTSTDPFMRLSFPDVDILAGRRIALLGVSGSGKSTFLNLIAGLDDPDRNADERPKITYTFADGTEAEMTDTDTPFPRDRLGFVFQEGHLITDASAGINAALPGLLNGIPASEDDLERFMEGLRLPADAARREAWRLSGGQKQRVAILRALLHGPEIIFADEPTSSVDKRTAAAIMQLLVDFQQQQRGRTLFWATHDLPLAAQFATDFLIVRKPNGGPVELEGPMPNPHPQPLTHIEEHIYAGTDIPPPQPIAFPHSAAAEKKRREIPFTQAKIGTSLTFARRNSPLTFRQLGRFGNWMSSVASTPPPILRAGLEFFQLYRRRFSDFSVAVALGLPILLLTFVFTGLWTMMTVRKQAMEDPTQCHVIASAPDAESGTGRTVLLDDSRLGSLNARAKWRSFDAGSPCGEAQHLVFGRRTGEFDLGVLHAGTCERLADPPKTLIANLREPAIASIRAQSVAPVPATRAAAPAVSPAPTPAAGAAHRRGKAAAAPATGAAPAPAAVAAQPVRQLGDMIGPQGSFTASPGEAAPLNGSELFLSASLKDKITKKLRELKASDKLHEVRLCVDGNNTPLRVGAVAQELPHPVPRGKPYELLVQPSSIFVPQDQNYHQAVFYTHPDKAHVLQEILDKEGFIYMGDDVEHMISMSTRFKAIHALIWIVGVIIVAAVLLFLYNGVAAFMEKNARPNAVLRAHGLTERKLRRQILWRLGAIAPYSITALLLIIAGFALGFPYLFSALNLPLPPALHFAVIIVSAFVAMALLTFGVVWLAVKLWWRRHVNIAQELA